MIVLSTGFYEKELFWNFVVDTAKEGKILYIENKTGSAIWGKLQSLPRHIQNLDGSIQQKEDVVNSYLADDNNVFKWPVKPNFSEAENVVREQGKLFNNNDKTSISLKGQKKYKVNKDNTDLLVDSISF